MNHALYQEHDVAAERYWSPKYIQHSAHIGPGREGLFNLIKSIPPTLKYEPGTIVADEDFVIVHGRYSGIGAADKLDCSRHRSHQGRCSCGTLGCNPRRGNPGTVKEWSSHVRGQISEFFRIMN